MELLSSADEAVYTIIHCYGTQEVLHHITKKFALKQHKQTNS